MMDLRGAPREAMEKHMGKEGSAAFFAWHRVAAQAAA